MVDDHLVRDMFPALQSLQQMPTPKQQMRATQMERIRWDFQGLVVPHRIPVDQDHKRTGRADQVALITDPQSVSLHRQLPRVSAREATAMHRLRTDRAEVAVEVVRLEAAQEHRQGARDEEIPHHPQLY